MSQRSSVVGRIAAEIRALRASGITRVGIDGVDGAGKTHFADELAEVISDVDVIRSSVDGFHHPKAVRYLQGKHSPRGFFEDSYDYDSLKEWLLDPLSPGGSMHYRLATFDYRTDAFIDSPTLVAQPPSILVFDGIFLHRKELSHYWDYSVFLDVSTGESVRRCVLREGSPGTTTDPSDPIHHRYVKGQELYLTSCQPKSKATRVIDNNHLDQPYVVA